MYTGGVVPEYCFSGWLLLLLPVLLYHELNLQNYAS